MSYSFLTRALVSEDFMERIFVFILYYRVLKILFPRVLRTKFERTVLLEGIKVWNLKYVVCYRSPEQYITFSVLFVSTWRNRNDCIDLFTREEEEEINSRRDFT